MLLVLVVVVIVAIVTLKMTRVFRGILQSHTD